MVSRHIGGIVLPTIRFSLRIKIMKALAAVFCVVALTAIGCGQSTTQTIPNPEITPVSLELCGDCGQVKGSETCCAADGEECKCGFHKGSPACCKLEKTGEDLTLCVKCGELAGGEKCCGEGEVCDCGFHKGSPACCSKDAMAVAKEIVEDMTDEHADHDHDGEDHDHDHDHDEGEDSDA